MTASYLSGIFGLVPALAISGIVGPYSLYLFYVGATPVLAVSEDKAIGFYCGNRDPGDRGDHRVQRDLPRTITAGMVGGAVYGGTTI